MEHYPWTLCVWWQAIQNRINLWPSICQCAQNSDQGSGKNKIVTTSIEHRTELRIKSFDKLSQDQLKAIEGIKNTKYGIEIKLHGKEWSIEKINKHIGFYEIDNEQKNPGSIPSTPEERKQRIEFLKAKLLGKES